MTTRTIKLSKNTAKHAETLKKAGYEVAEVDGVLQIQAESVIETADFSSEEKAKEAVKNAIAEKAVFSYTTKFDFGDKVLFSIPACNRVEQIIAGASALITKGEKEKKEAPVASVSMSDLL